jgi:hypothetical protein
VTLQTALVATPDSTAFRPSDTRSKWAMVLVGISTWALILSGVTFAQGIALVDNLSSTSAAEIAEWEQFAGAANGLYVLALIASGVAFLAWLSRVVDNVPSLGGGEPSVSPRGAIGWWFVPGANLVKPYLIVADVWRRLASTTAERRTRLLLVWWLAWVGGSLAGWILGRIEPTTIADLRSLLLLTILTIAAQALGGILLIRIVWEVERRVRLRAAAVPSTPPASSGPALGERGIAFCPACGSERVQDARFCSSCGASLDV